MRMTCAVVSASAKTADAIMEGLEWRPDAGARAALRKGLPRGIPAFVRGMTTRVTPDWLRVTPVPGCTLRAMMADVEGAAFTRGDLTHALITGLQVLRRLLPSGHVAPRQLDVYYLPGARAKLLPDQAGATLTGEHVNSGVTVFYATGPVKIIVYRREDACKVIIHELIHAMGIHSLWHSSASAGDEGGLNEAYVDALACYIHALWSAARTGRGVKTAIRRTRSHILAVAARVQHHFGQHTWSETTPAHAYYVGKAALWFDLPTFLATIPCLGGRCLLAVTDVRRMTAVIQSALRSPAFLSEMTRRRKSRGARALAIPMAPH